MTSSNLNRIGGLFILALFFVFNVSLHSQDQIKVETQVDPAFHKTATELTNTLSQKVTLTPDQSKEITDVLIDYQTDIADLDPAIQETDRTTKISEIDKSIQTEITSILDENQLTSYNAFKVEWWKEVINKTQSGTVRQNMDKDKPY
ncbi:MAG TPA: hypothetical protein VLN45_10470 [Ignavibacteriaceae bacterium]|nr:hypothetical protein [Ignavibacteriaceae bacterium]